MVSLIDAWKREEQRPFRGWDFSYLQGRMLNEEPPWSYADRAAGLLRRSSSVLDIGTGGGEQLLDPEKYVPLLERAGLLVETVNEWSGELAFSDVGALVYYLKAVPWLVPGFAVETHAQNLLRLQGRLDAGDRLRFESRMFLIEARKP